jgi:hypothetical protein
MGAARAQAPSPEPPPPPDGPYNELRPDGEGERGVAEEPGRSRQQRAEEEEVAEEPGRSRQQRAEEEEGLQWKGRAEVPTHCRGGKERVWRRVLAVELAASHPPWPSDLWKREARHDEEQRGHGAPGLPSLLPAVPSEVRS